MNSTDVQNLPILEKRSEILSLICKNQVVIVAGQTGSGKTTQLPLFCLEAGLGKNGMIGCTQPRRIAATSIASRVASLAGEDVGGRVGYKIRFSEKESPDTVIKFMTDGILLAELENDRLLSKYDTLIIDEAHERSLNIDFLLGYLRTLLPKRPDLKLIISSATIDTQLFSKSFNDAPVVEVSGRMYPIETLYKQLDADEEELDYVDDAVNSVSDLLNEYGCGDMLVFMPSERDIRETCEKLESLSRKRDLLVLPLFSRLTRTEQEAIFNISEKTKIVVCTNIAETSITVPGIRFVIDTGLARISRYAPRLRTNRLPIEKISRASANQRMGRCGRVQEGVCVRLYSEDDFLNREEFTQPEIRRSNLAGVILTMIAHGLGKIENFPFMEPPVRQAISEGYAQLKELGALNQHGAITRLGREMARLPFDPHISRMILAARQENALREVKIIAAALSIVDPRERPFDKQAEADLMHKRFTEETSDFLTYVKLWDAFQNEWKTLKTQTKMRKFCKEHFLSFTRMREWHDVHQQLQETLSRMKGFFDNTTPAPSDSIHRSLLSGLLANCAVLDKNSGRYKAMRGKEVVIFPGSALAKKKNEWIMCHEIVETSQVFARTVASIHPSWLEELAGPLCKKSYDAPFFDEHSGTVKATERVSLFGLLISIHTGAAFGRVNPKEAGEIFIREGLIEERLRCHHSFYKHNRNLKKQILLMEEKLRTRTLYAGDEAIFNFYLEKLENITSIHDLNRIIKRNGSDQFLYMNKEDLLCSPDPVDKQLFPDQVKIGDKTFPLSYVFDPGSEKDGITLKLSHYAVSYIQKESLAWLVPALWPELIKEFIRNLPRELRKNFIPINEAAERIASVFTPADQPFSTALLKAMETLYNVAIDPKLLDWGKISPHLKMRLEIHSKDGEIIARGREDEILESQKAMNSEATESPWDVAFRSFHRKNLNDWPDENLSEPVQIGSSQKGLAVKGYPALADNGDSIDLLLYPSQEESDRVHKAGVRKMVEIALLKDLAWTERELSFTSQTKLRCAPFGSPDIFKALLYKLICRSVLDFSTAPRNRSGYETLVEATRGKLRGIGFRTISVLEESLALLAENTSRIRGFTGRLPIDIRKELDSDLNSYFEDLLKEKFTHEQFLQFPRYLRAFGARIEKAATDPLKYRQKLSLLREYQRRYEMYLKKGSDSNYQTALQDLKLMIDEFAINIFAQHIKTLFPVSEKRLEKKLEEIEKLL